jgi:hypothetical protein
MKHVEQLVSCQVANFNPGQHIGRFLMQHSSSLEYLHSQLTAYLQAVEADMHEENRVFSTMLQHAHKQRKDDAC